MLNLTRETGQGLAEYGLVLVLIAVVIVAILTLTGSQVSSLYSTIMSQMPTA